MEMLPLVDGTATAWPWSSAVGDLLLFSAGASASSVSVGSVSGASRELSKSQEVTIIPGNEFPCHTALFICVHYFWARNSSGSRDVDIWIYIFDLMFQLHILQIYRKGCLCLIRVVKADKITFRFLLLCDCCSSIRSLVFFLGCGSPWAGPAPTQNLPQCAQGVEWALLILQAHKKVANSFLKQVIIHF